ncbi:hypothetical protein Hamer_G005372 [Homarus americanus]|uniref:Uncharacterized protein n=1 Tax=Homarus americanus TaxID=6706 RepID=A0A8J5JZV6_HOMAM|nr:hypothetical protein Hamer_G005372 [Homarus americanus]
MGTANSFLKAAHVTRTRRGHQITAATLNILQHKAYGKYTEDAQSDGHESLEFESNSSLYMDALAELCQWFLALDHTHYSRWVPVHLKGMTELSDKHPDLADKITDAPHVTSIILDGPAIVEMLKPGGSRAFQEYSTAVFIPYIESQLEYRSQLDLEWDCYLKSGSLKATVRCNRGKGIRRWVTASGPLPSNWQNFLRNSDNKEEPFSFLSKQVMQLVVKESKQLVVTDKKQVLTVPPRKDTANLAPWNHEEADTKMMVHAADALECGHRRILIRTVDTDVILAVGLANERSEHDTSLSGDEFICFSSTSPLTVVWVATDFTVYVRPEKLQRVVVAMLSTYHNVTNERVWCCRALIVTSLVLGSGGQLWALRGVGSVLGLREWISALGSGSMTWGPGSGCQLEVL